ncbi:MAG: translation initiation factor IF-3 [Halothiobacillus sp.]
MSYFEDKNIAQLRAQTPPATRDPDEPRINGEITAREVRLVDENGEQMGIVRTRDALDRAVQVALDLVEVSATANPPVCKIMDYGKFKYQQSKKLAEARKKQKQIEVKEIKFRPGTEDHDYQVKMRSIVRFLEEGDKAKITLRFRGREMAHKEIAAELLDRIEKDLTELAVVEQRPKMEGRQVTMVLAPKKTS